MNKPYSNKALPAGTVLREWRLEEVLGVGGFGIVYKGRGIYFDELVAIKEYFPSSISERQEGDTVVPIDSDAEEVHALGLKKFVEEAKLLWNLSTPTRHPNIVSVRSLFEVHGTAYMVMDFEDGVSLSKLLKQGKRFNEASLAGFVRPIAEGLERAHRVGVLHRDIKPANILMNEDGRPVLIDFGSARFESGEATSTTVTFHTPPYAAIEQYVKTYEQGPWTDIYALGVVLYECVTGEKPAEVLERMHGGDAKPLAASNWPGFSRPFLAAIDTAMTIRPDERPQTIREWLDLFDKPDVALPEAPQADEDDGEEATIVAKFEKPEEAIVPVAPPPPGFTPNQGVETDVPTSTKDVRFKRAGEDTNASQAAAYDAGSAAPVPEASPSEPDSAQSQPPVKPPADSPAPQAAASPPGNKAAPTGKASSPGKAAKPAKAPKAGKAPNRTPLIAGGAIAAALLIGGGWLLFGSGLSGPSSDPELVGLDDAAGAAAVSEEAAPVEVGNTKELIEAVQSLASDARRAKAPAAAVKQLDTAGTQLASLAKETAGLSGAAANAKENEMTELAKAASARFANALATDANSRAQRIAREVPWADPRRAGAAQAESAKRKSIATSLRNAFASVRNSSAAAGKADDAGQALGEARNALAASGRFSAAYYQAVRSGTGEEPQLAQAPEDLVPSAAPEQSAAPVEEQPAEAPGGISAGKLGQYKAIESSARDVAQQILRFERNAKSGLPDEAKRVLDENAKSAQTYLKYLDTLTSSLRAAKTDREVDQAIIKANQTKTYLNVLHSGSRAAAK